MTNLLLIDGICFFFVVQRGPEIAHAALCSGYQMVANGHLQRLLAVVLDVESQSVLQETQGQLVFANGMQNQTDVALKMD